MPITHQPPPGDEPGKGVLQTSVLRAQQRARRFSVQTPLRYRTVEDRQWREGFMINVSESGILFEAESPLEIKTRVELAFGLKTGEAPFRCRARASSRG